MRPPLAGRRAAARRLAQQLRGRLEPVERILAPRLHGSEARRQPAVRPAAAGDAARGRAEPVPEDAGARTEPVPEDAAEPVPEDVGARIDAARDRLRAQIESPDEPDA